MVKVGQVKYLVRKRYSYAQLRTHFSCLLLGLKTGTLHESQMCYTAVSPPSPHPFSPLGMLLPAFALESVVMCRVVQYGCTSE